MMVKGIARTRGILGQLDAAKHWHTAGNSSPEYLSDMSVDQNIEIIIFRERRMDVGSCRAVPGAIADGRL